MEAKKIRAAIFEAERFVERAQIALKDAQDYEAVDATTWRKFSLDGKIQAACKRSSMELTRALSCMRSRS